MPLNHRVFMTVAGRLLGAFFLSLMLVSTPLMAADGGGFFDENFGNLKDELAGAKQEGKAGVFVFFEMEECPFCHKMKTTVFSQPEVATYFRKHFRILSIDINGDVEMVNFKGQTTTQKKFAFDEYRVRATPVMGFFDLDGNLVNKYTGPTRDAREFMLLGEFIVSGAFRQPGMNFTVYKKSKGQ
ncbi:MAG: thioredoxin family protein [Pseudomonadota bacterium]